MKLWALLVCLLPSMLMYGQESKILKDEILVQAKSGINERDLNAGIPDIGTYIKILSITKIAKSINVYKVKLSRVDNNGDMLEQFLKSPMVIKAHYNGITFLRRTPNDREYNRQWGLRNIRMPKAWDVSVGSNGQRAPIVVAILDSGIDRDHNDLSDNIWFNKFEIPNDGKDNDGNGYIDDYYGLNIQTNRDDNFKHYHGTQVAGIIGAETDNTDGIAGVNWHAELMTIALAKTGGFQFDEIIKGMSYVLDQRKSFNDSDGEKGSFVTALNFSLGDLGWFEASFSIICGLFDSLGEEGVLTIAATDNSNSNIDILGDLPCDCKSKYLLTVTNSDKLDKKVDGAGYGVVGIDLAAPGEDILSTSTDGRYKTGSGCSFAAPLVAGVISLLYSLECDNMQSLILQNPANAALLMKDAVISGVDRNLQLDSLVLSGGRLNANKSIEYIQLNYCADKLPKTLQIINITPNPSSSSIELTIKTTVNSSHSIKIVDGLGKIMKIIEVPFSAIPTQMLKIDVDEFVCGSYFILLSNGTDKVSKLFVVCS